MIVSHVDKRGGIVVRVSRDEDEFDTNVEAMRSNLKDRGQVVYAKFIVKSLAGNTHPLNHPTGRMFVRKRYH